jgi:lipid II:glycine glycyltransferase (peptidoglycan interpeptide bridge formation enzyme)
MRRLSALPRSYHFFKVAWERLRPLGLMQLLLAEHFGAGRTRLLGGFLLLMYGQTVSHAYSGWSWPDRSLRPNDALHWKAIQDACAKGFRCYDFGAASRSKGGLAEYKSKWGAETKLLYSYYYPASQKLEVDIHAPGSSARQLTLAVLQRLPISTVGLLSDWAHRYL